MNNENELKSKQNNPTLFISFNWINRPLNFLSWKRKKSFMAKDNGSRIQKYGLHDLGTLFKSAHMMFVPRHARRSTWKIENFTDNLIFSEWKDEPYLWTKKLTTANDNNSRVVHTFCTIWALILRVRTQWLRHDKRGDGLQKSNKILCFSIFSKSAVSFFSKIRISRINSTRFSVFFGAEYGRNSYFYINVFVELIAYSRCFGLEWKN